MIVYLSQSNLDIGYPNNNGDPQAAVQFWIPAPMYAEVVIDAACQAVEDPR